MLEAENNVQKLEARLAQNVAHQAERLGCPSLHVINLIIIIIIRTMSAIKVKPSSKVVHKRPHASQERKLKDDKKGSVSPPYSPPEELEMEVSPAIPLIIISFIRRSLHRLSGVVQKKHFNCHQVM